MNGKTNDGAGSSSDYSSFRVYYENVFPKELGAFFASYCKDDIHMNETKFLGFNRDHLVHMDTIVIGMNTEKLTWPENSHMAWFMLGIWSVAAADIAVYSFYRQYAQTWETGTRYPKFTGWNYYATEPNYLFHLAEDRCPSATGEIESFISDSGGQFTGELSGDIARFLGLSARDRSFIKDFMMSWLTTDTTRKGTRFDVECFLH